MIKDIKEIINTVVQGNAVEVLKNMPANSIDTILTDPPYGLGFMGKDWDTFKEKELKKATSTSTWGLDGRRCSPATIAGSYDFSRNAEFQQWFTVWAVEALRVCKPGAMMLIFGGTRTYHRLTCAIEDAGWQIRDCLMWLYSTGFPKSHDISKAIDKAKGVKPISKKPAYGTIASRELIDKRGWHNINNALIMPKTQTDLAKLWDGWGTALKPAWEPILVCMKSLQGTFAQNAEKWGVAGLNIDGARIPSEKLVGARSSNKDGIARRKVYSGQWQEFEGNPIQGRWPANLILDEEAASMLDEQSGNKCGQIAPTTGKEPSVTKKNQIYGDYSKVAGKSSQPKDNLAGASRFFYCAKASRSERNAGLEGMPEKPAFDNPSGAMGGNMGSLSKPRQNNHPTVKPLKLMEYLCKLTMTPTGGIVLDCFGGSGTTAMACIRTGRDYILIEKEKEYCEIAEKRIEAVKQECGLFQ